MKPYVYLLFFFLASYYTYSLDTGVYKCLMNIYLEIYMITNSSDMYRTRNANNFVILLLVDL